MAEIRIQEKKRPVWPWILLILILIIAAVLLYFYLTRDQNYNNIDETTPADTTTYNQDDTSLGDIDMQPGDEVDQYTDFASADTIGFSKEYVANGLNLLSGAVSNVAYKVDAKDNIVKATTDSLMSYTQDLSDTSDRTFPGRISKSFSAAYEVISSIQRKVFPDLNKEVNELRSTVQSFNPAKAVETQQRTVKNFFRISGSILSNMKNTARAI